MTRAYLAISLCAHAALLAIAYYLGSYQPRSRQQQADVASSLHATSMAVAAKRLQDLAAIKRLLEDAVDGESRPDTRAESAVSAETPDELVARARELASAIEALERQIRVEELAKLLDETSPPPGEVMPAPPGASAAAETPSLEDADLAPGGSHFTAEAAALEVTALEARARDTLSRRQALLEARANGVQVSGGRVDPSPPPYSGNGGGADFFGNGDLVVPSVGAGLVPGHGRLLGTGGEFANRIYLNSWYIIGPFAAYSRGRQPDDSIYPPEQAVLLHAVYLGKDGRLLKWRYMNSQSYPLVPPDAAEDAIYYGYTEVSVEEDCDFTAWIGADDNAQVYLNDRQVWGGGSISLMQYLQAIWTTGATHLRDYNLTEGRRLLRFNKGRNKIFFKLLNGRQGTHLSLLLTRDSPCG